MTQRLHDERARQCCDEFTDCPHAAIGQQACEDLLSLRAAVRRVNALHWAFEQDECRRSWLELVEGLNALRAEMGGIDKDEGGKP